MADFREGVQVDGNDMQLFVSVPDGSGPFPAVVVIQHQGGVDAFVQEMTQRIAQAGYVGVAPDLYHRDGPDCQDDGPTRRARLQDVNVIKDVNATVDFLHAHDAVDGERLGIVGFCMGGRVVYLMAAMNPSFKVAAAYYGGNIMVPWGDGPAPFDRTAEIQCPLIGLFGEADSNPSPADMRTLDVELSKHGKVHEFHSYPGANHAFMNARGERYHAEAAQDSWPKTLAFFEKYLGKVSAASS
ncbi:MAG: dienelactone hydrolase family protein [Candidatus Tectomicrobia bacterium]|nr:dienelactone hydrolase family protein [Candidatus Tectomicrobia bacterium]